MARHSLQVPEEQSLPRGPTQNRACEECKTKKSKCGMEKPTCSRCKRCGTTCVYPTRRKPRRRSASQSTPEGNNLGHKLDHILQVLNMNYLSTSPQPHLPSTEQTDRGGDTKAPRPDPFTAGFTGLTGIHEPHNQVNVLATSEYLNSEHQFATAETLSNFWSIDEISDCHEPGEQSIPDAFSVPQPVSFPSSRPEPDWKTDRTGYTLGISSESPPVTIIDELIELYFERIHVFVPIIHKPRFLRHLAQFQGPCQGRYSQLPPETAMILNAILALSARFSSTDYFRGVAPTDRGIDFARHAMWIHNTLKTVFECKSPTLPYLQGCILLALYQQTYEPKGSQSKLLTLLCIRTALDMGLNEIDEDILCDDTPIPQWLSANEWTQREELRRAWWSTWELDVFDSVMSCAPPSINKHSVQVLLPVSDEDWFQCNPVASAAIPPNFQLAWKCLRGVENQSARAWFLVATYLMFLADEMTQKRIPSAQSISEMETALSCFSLLLPPDLRLDAISDNSSDDQGIHIISIDVMLQSVHIIVGLLSQHAPNFATQEHGRSPDCSPSSPSGFPSGSCDYQAPTKSIFRTLQALTPSRISCASPFLSCAIVGPAAVNIQAARQSSRTGGASLESTVIYEELLRLILKEFGRYWHLGAAVLEHVEYLDSCGAFDVVSGKDVAAKADSRFPRLLPGLSRRMFIRATLLGR